MKLIKIERWFKLRSYAALKRGDIRAYKNWIGLQRYYKRCRKLNRKPAFILIDCPQITGMVKENKL